MGQLSCQYKNYDLYDFCLPQVHVTSFEDLMLKEMLQIMLKLSRLLSLNLEHVLLYRYESIQSPVRCSQRIFKKNCVLFAHDCFSLS